jgi:hypothetical protein
MRSSSCRGDRSCTTLEEKATHGSLESSRCSQTISSASSWLDPVETHAHHLEAEMLHPRSNSSVHCDAWSMLIAYEHRVHQFFDTPGFGTFFLEHFPK